MMYPIVFYHSKQCPRGVPSHVLQATWKHHEGVTRKVGPTVAIALLSSSPQDPPALAKENLFINYFDILIEVIFPLFL